LLTDGFNPLINFNIFYNSTLVPSFFSQTSSFLSSHLRYLYPTTGNIIKPTKNKPAVVQPPLHVFFEIPETTCTYLINIYIVAINITINHTRLQIFPPRAIAPHITAKDRINPING